MKLRYIVSPGCVPTEIAFELVQNVISYNVNLRGIRYTALSDVLAPCFDCIRFIKFPSNCIWNEVVRFNEIYTDVDFSDIKLPRGWGTRARLTNSGWTGQQL